MGKHPDIQMAAALEEADSRELARQCESDIAGGSCLMERKWKLKLWTTQSYFNGS